MSATYRKKDLLVVAKVKSHDPLERSPAVDKRRTSRRISGRSVVVKSTNGERAKAVIRDVSVYGCSLVGDAAWMRTGSFVAIVLSAERSIQAIVRWSRSGVSGVEFLRPIPDAEAEDIVES
jgi:phosphosulfolactate phosphohydrolase-like enzyme